MDQINSKHISNAICQFLTFLANGNIYAVSTSDVLQIIEKPHITPIAETAPYIRGLIRLREHNIPIIDLGLRLRESAVEHSGTSKIVVLSTSIGDLGLIVESIGEIINLPQQDVSHVPPLAFDVGNHVLSSVAVHNGQLIPILDVQILLSDEAITSIDLEVK